MNSNDLPLASTPSRLEKMELMKLSTGDGTYLENQGLRQVCLSPGFVACV